MGCKRMVNTYLTLSHSYLILLQSSSRDLNAYKLSRQEVVSL